MNQLVREIHVSDETAHTFRKLEERRNRSSAKAQGYDRSLAECHTTKSSTSISKGGFQTGISAFFASGKSDKSLSSKPSKDQHIKSVLETTGKRKDSPTALDDTSSNLKKPKKLAPLFVVSVQQTNVSGPERSPADGAMTKGNANQSDLEAASLQKEAVLSANN